MEIGNDEIFKYRERRNIKIIEIMEIWEIVKNEVSSRWIHKTGGRKTPNWMWNCIFCEPTRIWGQTTLVLGLLKLEFHSRFDKKYFARNHFRFVIFSLFYFVSFRNV